MSLILTVARIQGLHGSVAIKAAARALATENIALSGLQTLGGVELVEGTRVLVTGQSNPAENGIYYASTSNWSRTPDANGAKDVWEGTLVPVFISDELTLYYVTSYEEWASAEWVPGDPLYFVKVLLGDENMLRANVTDTLTVGFTSTVFNTTWGGTVQITPANSHYQSAINNSAATLSPVLGATGSVDLYVLNGSTPGAVNTGAFTKVTGSFTTTPGDKFLCHITILGAVSHLNIQPLQ